MNDRALPPLITGDTDSQEWLHGNPAGVGKAVSIAREEGYINLTPFQRQFAMEFVMSGTTLRKIAKVMDLPLSIVQKMYNTPVVRAYISDLQKEVAAHRLVNDQWVENQIMKIMPKLLGEEAVDIVTAKGCHLRKRKFHAPEITSLLKHFSGSQEQKNTGGGVNVQINFADILTPAQQEQVTVKVVGEQ